MHKIQVPYKNFNDEPKTAVVYFNLTETEVFKLLVEFKAVLDWQERIDGPARELPTEEVVDFYTNLEKILLEAWGVPSADGEHFRKSGRYEFEESAVFNACMLMFLSDPKAAGELLEGLLPKGMDELIKHADANLEEAAQKAKDSGNADQSARIAELQRQVAELTAGQQPASQQIVPGTTA